MMDGWYPVALGADIQAGTSAGTVLGGQEVVIWRDTAGQAHAWEDRCPHRGMKLSFGFVRGDHIACLYHGWEYDPSGQCRRIPAHPDLEVPKTICATTYGVTEAGGLIWVRMSGDAPAPVAPEATPLRSLFVDAPAEAVLAALPALGTVQGAAPLLTVGEMTVGVQPVDTGRTALHFTVPGETTPEARAGLAARTVALRRQIEG